MSINTTNPTRAARLAWLLRIWRFLTEAHPSVQEVGERRRAQLLASLSLILTLSFTLALLSRPASVAIFYILLAFTLVAYLLGRSRFYRAGAYFFSFGFTSFAYLTIYLGTANTVESAINAFVPVAVILSSVLLSQRGFVILAVSSVLATILVPFYSQVPPAPNESVGRMIGILVSINALLIGINTYRASVERARLKELTDTNRELEDIRTNLEQRVGERTLELESANRQTSRRAAQLQAITELSESIGKLQDLGELFPSAANLISQRFGFYHVGIFLVDNDREYAILQAANSEGGKRMLGRGGHRLKLGTGVVGFVARTGQPRIALDVGSDAVFFDNPDLPDTRSEVALPLKARGDTIGVLDVQSTDPSAFSSEDLQVLTALGNQVSIALENTRLLTETRAALRQVEEVYNEFTRAEWSRAVVNTEQAGFRYQAGRIEMVENQLNNQQVVSAVKTGQVVTSQTDENQEPHHIVTIPVKLRGEVIGVLQVDSSDPAKTWRADEVGLIEAVAERAAIALENARLFQDARRRAAKERLISEASARIGGASNIENILQTTAQELERVLGGSEVLILFQNKEPQ